MEMIFGLPYGVEPTWRFLVDLNTLIDSLVDIYSASPCDTAFLVY